MLLMILLQELKLLLLRSLVLQINKLSNRLVLRNAQSDPSLIEQFNRLWSKGWTTCYSWYSCSRCTSLWPSIETNWREKGGDSFQSSSWSIWPRENMCLYCGRNWRTFSYDSMANPLKGRLKKDKTNKKAWSYKENERGETWILSLS
jgi:hypothetical protein